MATDLVLRELTAEELARYVVQLEASYADDMHRLLNVFGDNAVARHLYRSAGFREQRVTMTKRLT